MFMKIGSTIFAVLATLLSLLLVVTLLTPIAYFAWRAGQPMNLPEFHGLTYIQLLTERRDAYDQLAHTYQASHPNVEVKPGICFGAELAVEITFSWPVSGLYTTAAISPSVKGHLNPQAIRMGLVPEHVSALSFLPAWWATFEKMVWGLSAHAPHGPVAYCRITMP